MILIDAKIALMKAEQNKANKQKERYEALLNPFIVAIENAIMEGETFAQVTIPGATKEDLAGVFQQLDLKGYSVFANGQERWLVKFKKVEAIPLVATPPAVVTHPEEGEGLDEDAFEREYFPEYDDDDVPF